MCTNDRIKTIIKRLKIIYKDMSLEQILINRGIVLRTISGKDIARGAYKKYGDIQVIYINEDLCELERLITLAHELGHSILHPDVDTYELKKSNCTYFLTRYENQARLFAAEFLLPDSIIDTISGCIYEVGEGKSIDDIASDYGVSVELVLIKLNNLDKSKFTRFPVFFDYFLPSNPLNY